MTSELRDNTAEVDPGALLRPHVMVCAGVIVLLLGAVFWDFLRKQFQFATNMPEDWGHTFVIPLIAGYFVYLLAPKLLKRPFRTTWIALVPILLGIAWYSLCTFGPAPLFHHNLRGAGFALTVTGVVLLFTGWRAMVLLWFPLLYMFVFGQTISERLMHLVTFKLQDITARGAYFFLVVMGLDMEIRGNTLTVFDSAGQGHPLNVAEACSGMRMLMAFLALGVAMAFTGLKHFWQQAVLVLMGVPVAIFVNVLRVVTLSLLSQADTGFATGEFHAFVGLLWLLPAFMMYLGVVWLLRNVVRDEPPAKSKAGAARV